MNAICDLRTSIRKHAARVQTAQNQLEHERFSTMTLKIAEQLLALPRGRTTAAQFDSLVHQYWPKALEKARRLHDHALRIHQFGAEAESGGDDIKAEEDIEDIVDDKNDKKDKKTAVLKEKESDVQKKTNVMLKKDSAMKKGSVIKKDSVVKKSSSKKSKKKTKKKTKKKSPSFGDEKVCETNEEKMPGPSKRSQLKSFDRQRLYRLRSDARAHSKDVLLAKKPVPSKRETLFGTMSLHLAKQIDAAKTNLSQLDWLLYLEFPVAWKKACNTLGPEDVLNLSHKPILNSHDDENSLSETKKESEESEEKAHEKPLAGNKGVVGNKRERDSVENRQNTENADDEPHSKRQRVQDNKERLLDWGPVVPGEALSSTQINTKVLRSTDKTQSIQKAKGIKFTVQWTEDDVANWLNSIHALSIYSQKFQECVDGATLLDLSDFDLQEHLGVSDTVHRKRILSDIKKFKKTVQLA